MHPFNRRNWSGLAWSQALALAWLAACMWWVWREIEYILPNDRITASLSVEQSIGPVLQWQLIHFGAGLVTRTCVAWPCRVCPRPPHGKRLRRSPTRAPQLADNRLVLLACRPHFRRQCRPASQFEIREPGFLVPHQVPGLPGRRRAPGLDWRITARPRDSVRAPLPGGRSRPGARHRWCRGGRPFRGGDASACESRALGGRTCSDLAPYRHHRHRFAASRRHRIRQRRAGYPARRRISFGSASIQRCNHAPRPHLRFLGVDPDRTAPRHHPRPVQPDATRHGRGRGHLAGRLAGPRLSNDLRHRRSAIRKYRRIIRVRPARHSAHWRGRFPAGLCGRHAARESRGNQRGR